MLCSRIWLELELAVIEPGTLFGEMPLLGESLRHTLAEAVEDSLICVMSRADIEGPGRRIETIIACLNVKGARDRIDYHCSTL